MDRIDRAALERVAGESSFSGVLSVDGVTFCRGLADRAHGIPITPATRFGIASGSKAFTAVAVVSLVADGTIALATTARQLLGADLPMIDERVTVEQLLAHRSGIGDYLDEGVHGDVTEHVMPVPVHLLADTEQFLAVLDGFPQVSAPGETCAYNNGGYVVLALLAERASGVPFHDLVQQRVFDPAGMAGAAYLRNDELPGDVAIGYLFADGLRTNALHLPVRGSGDGGAQAGVTDLDAFWRALFAGALLADDWVTEMTTPHSDGHQLRSGLGLWLRADGGVQIEGYDAGVSFRSVHWPATSATTTVVSNWSDGAWPVCEVLAV